MQDDAGFLFALVVGDDLLVVGFAEEGEHGAVAAGTRLDDVRDELFAGRLVDVFLWFADRIGVRFQVVVGAVGDALELLDAEREFVFDVVGLF